MLERLLKFLVTPIHKMACKYGKHYSYFKIRDDKYYCKCLYCDKEEEIGYFYDSLLYSKDVRSTK